MRLDCGGRGCEDVHCATKVILFARRECVNLQFSITATGEGSHLVIDKLQRRR